ncbi:MAG: 50S ribosomal protein L35 [Candidatus Pacebacteria bacterium]|nr:50S ribosomal protein L35 [Candidatus Paceibacterota bacterium]
MKTNKSYTKRLKMTKNGKITARKPGQDHFNAKESRRSQLNKKRSTPFVMTMKSKSRFMPNH